MKILYVSGGDYAALTFEEWLGKKSLHDFVEKLESGKKLPKALDDIEFEVLNFGDVDPAFIMFIRNEIQDYDITKSINFYTID